MADTPFKIQMNQDGAILKASSNVDDMFIVMPDYIKLEKASYPRMTVNPIEPWTEEEPPPEDYGKNIIDDTFEENWYYTFYCDSVAWDGKEETLDKSGDGSKENPWRNFFFACEKLQYYVNLLCCNDRRIRLIVNGCITHTSYYAIPHIYFNWKVVIDLTQALVIVEVPSLATNIRLIHECILFDMQVQIRESNTRIQIENCKLYSIKLDSLENIDVSSIEFFTCSISNMYMLKGAPAKVGIYDCICKRLNITANHYIDSHDSTFLSSNLKQYSPTADIVLDCEVGLLDTNITTSYIYRSRINSDAIGFVRWSGNLIYKSTVNHYCKTELSPYNYLFTLIYMPSAFITDSEFNLVIDTIYGDGFRQLQLTGISLQGNSLIKNSKISLNGTLPSVENWAISCPVNIYYESNAFILNCDIHGYETIGNVPEDMQCRI